LTKVLLLLSSLTACEPTARHIPPESFAPGDVASAETGALPDGSVAATDSDAASDLQPVSPPRDAGPPHVFDPDATSALFLRFPDPVANLLHGEEQRAQLCTRGRDDLVTDAFCGGSAPRITSLADLLTLLDVDPSAPVAGASFSITGHSTSLTKRSASAINPRVIFTRSEYGSSPLLSVAFTRGETIVEIVTRNRTTKELQFYVVSFTLRCNDAGGECSPGEVLTSAIERDWQRVDLYGEEDLKNTSVDCRTCHQPAGPATSKLLRMQELDLPWTHWFDLQTRGGRALLDDYYAAHGQEALAGIPGFLVKEAAGSSLAGFVSVSGSRMQPNEFLSTEIENDVERSAPNQPADNQTRGNSETWRAIFQAAQRGEAIPVPYHDVKITDPGKLNAMQQAYTQYLAGSLPQSALPDIRDVLPDDPMVLAEMGFTLDERLDDSVLLTAACALCHNAHLDQSLSRARFHTDLARLSAEEKKLAIERLSLPGHDPLAMPPRRIHDLSDAARNRLVALLRR
jgi:hypothetical protein